MNRDAGAKNAAGIASNVLYTAHFDCWILILRYI